MDGQFVPNISFGEVVVDAVRQSTDLPLNIHLMVREPDYLLPGLVKSPTDQVLVHAEACNHLHRTLSVIKDGGQQAGVALNPGHPGRCGGGSAAPSGYRPRDDRQPRGLGGKHLFRPL